jgi:hypothetical protein
MPMILCKVNDDWHQHWEGLLFVCLQDVKEVIVLKKAHCTIGNLQVDSTDTPDDSLEESWDEMLNFVYFADLKNFL